MVVEADDERAVEWTKPQDWQFDAKQPLAGLGRAHPAPIWLSRPLSGVRGGRPDRQLRHYARQETS